MKGGHILNFNPVLAESQLQVGQNSKALQRYENGGRRYYQSSLLEALARRPIRMPL